MKKEYEELLNQAFQKASTAYDKMSKALLEGDKEGFEHWHSEYCRYCELFSKSMGISEEKFIELVDAFRERQSKSE